MFELKPIARHLLLACGGLAGALLIASPASAQQAQGQEQKLERITITGSNIRRTDTETVAPVEIITREEIEKSGKATVAEVLRSIPSNTAGSYNESFSNSFAPGASGISLRGLGQKATLVLINGRRTSGYGFAQNLQDTFVDLNSIPSSAIERIEILKDGASAIYGSDAIAGVVNLILRRDFKGLETAAQVGFFEGTQDYRASITGGIGDLGSGRFNVFGVLDFYQRDELLLSDTEFGKTRDYRGEQGGRNFQNLTTGGTWANVVAAPTVANPSRVLLGNTRQAIAECARFGRVVNAAEAVSLGLLSAASAQNIPTNTWCLTDLNSTLSALPGTTRIGGLVRGTFDFTNTFQGFVELGLSRVETEQTFTPPFISGGTGAGTTGLLPTPQGLRPFNYNVDLAPGSGGNPLGTRARLLGSLYELGTRDATITSDSWRVLAGAKYTFGGWDFDSAVGASENQIELVNTNRLSQAGVNAVLGVTPSPTDLQPPLSTASGYNFNNPSTNSAAVRSAMLTNVNRQATSELQFVDTRVSTELGSLPGGAIGFAAGAEYRSEKLKDDPDPLAQTGQILGQGITATNGSRNSVAVFTELALPLTNTLEAQLALRGDNYSDFGTAVTPKVGLKFRPSSEVVLRANWGRGFRAPTLPEISPSVATFFVQVNDPVTGAANQQVSGVFAGNPNLDAEKSRSSTVGIVFEPTTNLNFSLDWYEIKWSGIVGADSFTSILLSDAASRDPVTCAGGDPRVLRDPSTCGIVTIFNNYRNFSYQKTRGFDFDLRWTNRTAVGRLTTRLNAAYVDSYEVEDIEVAGDNSFGSIPRLKGSLSQEWERGPFTVRVAATYIDSYEQQLLAGSFFAPQDPRIQTGTYPLKVPSYTTFDLVGRYSITPKLQVSAAIVNLTNELPPYDPGADATNNYDFTQYDVRGRQYRIGVTYRF